MVSYGSLVLPGSRSAFGASYHGVRETRQRVGHLPPGCDALSSCILPGQKCRYENKMYLFSTHTAQGYN